MTGASCCCMACTALCTASAFFNCSVAWPAFNSRLQHTAFVVNSKSCFFLLLHDMLLHVRSQLLYGLHSPVYSFSFFQLRCSLPSLQVPPATYRFCCEQQVCLRLLLHDRWLAAARRRTATHRLQHTAFAVGSKLCLSCCCCVTRASCC